MGTGDVHESLPTTKMAELLIAKGYTPPDPLALRLREELPDRYWVVIGATVQGVLFDAIVVSATGLGIVHTAEEDLPELAPSLPSAAAPPAEAITPFSPARAVTAYTRALAAFLHDEFPNLQPRIHHLVVSLASGTAPARLDSDWPPITTLESLTTAIVAIEGKPGEPELPPALCRELAVALCERRLTLTQRAQEPFIFRAGGRMGSRLQAWTIADTIAHMDRHPDDAVFHLRNGTLARWYSAQGAEHMARLSHTALAEHSGDYRAALESFLVGTGRVPRPAISIRPRTLDFGSIPSGEKATAWLNVSRGSGRGYLYGTVRPAEPWLRVEPSRLSDGKLAAVVSVDSSSLPIRGQPYATAIEIVSNATDAPLSVPVRVQVSPLPSWGLVHLLRPLAAGSVCGLIGLGLGWMLGTSGLTGMAAAAVVRWVPQATALPLWLALACGALWLAVAALWTGRQPAVQPLKISMGRFLAKVGLWVIGLFLTAYALALAIQLITLEALLPNAVLDAWSLGLLAACFAVVPASTAGTPTSSPYKVEDPAQGGTKRWAIIGLLVLLVVTLSMANTRRMELTLLLAQAGTWLDGGAVKVEAGLDRIADGLMLRYFDRRAPSLPAPASSPTPVLLPTPTSSPLPTS